MPEEKEKKFAKDFLEKWSRAEREEGPADEALKDVDEALRARPEDPGLWFRRGSLLTDLERWDEALEAFRKVEAVDPAFPRLYVGLSFVLARLFIPMLPVLHARFPELTVRLDLSDRIVRLADEDIDVGLRLGALPDSSLVARLLRRTRWVTLASSDYLARRGTPRAISWMRASASSSNGRTVFRPATASRWRTYCALSPAVSDPRW